MYDDAKIPIKQSETAAGFDICAYEDKTIQPKNKALISTGLQMAIPEGYYGRIAPRSGLACKHFIDVGAGVIDSDYRGEIMVLLFNFSNEVFQVKKGDRIAQLVIEQILLSSFEEVDQLDTTERNENGFGSTGTD